MKLPLNKTIRHDIMRFARDVVDPLQERQALDFCKRQVVGILHDVIHSMAPARDLAVLKKYDAVEAVHEVRVFANTEGYLGLLRDVIQQSRDACVKVDDQLAYELSLTAKDIAGSSLEIAPRSFFTNAYRWTSRREMTVHTQVGSGLHTAVVAAKGATDAYDEEKARRLTVYQRLTDATRNFEDLLEEWPEIRPLYAKALAERQAQLPATLTVNDRHILEVDMGERKVAVVGEAPGAAEAGDAG